MSVIPSPANQVIINEELKIVKVIKNDYQVIVSRAGFQGIQGPQGPQGATGASVQLLDNLQDVISISPAEGDLLKYNGVLQVWKNSNIVDGGNF